MGGTEQPLVVFISSVMRTEVDDLSAEREATKATIDSLPITRSWAFEYSPASADPPDETYLDKVDECDIFVLILGAEITAPVAKEYARAKALNKRRLVFIKRMKKRSAKADEWLSERTDVKYAVFQDAEDLPDHVHAAIVDEVIKAHRQLRLREKDFAQLATKLRSEPVTFMVRTIDARELKTAADEFPELKELYPLFDEWVDGKMVAIGNGTATAYVATYGQASAGFALLSDKGDGVQKISTLYIKPRYQGLGVGPRLLYGALARAADEGVEKLYLTVSEERRQQLEGLLEQFGFFVEGVSGRRYRRGSMEWVWAKRMVHGRLEIDRLPRFVSTHLLEERGFVAERIGNRMYRATPRYGTGSLGRGTAIVVGVAGHEPKRDYARARKAADGLEEDLMFIVGDSKEKFETRAGDLIIDAFDLETIFFPMYVERSVEGIVLPIRESFVQMLLPRSDQSQFLEPTRVQLRTDNVYYRYPNVFDGLERGSPVFFYETNRKQGSSRLFGEAKLLEFAIDAPRDLLARFGQLGIYTLDNLKASTMKKGRHKGQALALRFDWFREIEQPLSLQQVKQVLPNFDPQTARRVPPSDVYDLRRLSGWNVAPLSSQ